MHSIKHVEEKNLEGNRSDNIATIDRIA